MMMHFARHYSPGIDGDYWVKIDIPGRAPNNGNRYEFEFGGGQFSSTEISSTTSGFKLAINGDWEFEAFLRIIRDVMGKISPIKDSLCIKCGASSSDYLNMYNPDEKIVTDSKRIGPSILERVAEHRYKITWGFAFRIFRSKIFPWVKKWQYPRIEVNDSSWLEIVDYIKKA